MSDDKKKPLDQGKTRVHVRVKPKKDDKDGRDYAEKVKKNVKTRIREEIKEKEDKGHRKQLDAAEDAVDDAKTKVSPQKVDKIDVTVEGEVDGDEIVRKKVVTPKGDGPTPDKKD